MPSCRSKIRLAALIALFALLLATTCGAWLIYSFVIAARVSLDNSDAVVSHNSAAACLADIIKAGDPWPTSIDDLDARLREAADSTYPTAPGKYRPVAPSVPLSEHLVLLPFDEVVLTALPCEPGFPLIADLLDCTAAKTYGGDALHQAMRDHPDYFAPPPTPDPSL
ncbi:MAG: hypothetical protein AAF747_03605 [Planctomycetota bacterium]